MSLHGNKDDEPIAIVGMCKSGSSTLSDMTLTVLQHVVSQAESTIQPSSGSSFLTRSLDILSFQTQESRLTPGTAQR